MADDAERFLSSPSMRTFHRLHAAHRGYRIIMTIGCVLALLSLLFWIVQGLDTSHSLSFPVQQATTGLHVMAQTHGSEHQIPPKIWQILLPKHASDTSKTVDPDVLHDTPTWLALNTDYM